jgi:uncharacterized OsmC-like protein
VLHTGDRGANPAEFVLHALAACLTTSMAYHAAVRGIRIEELESKVEGEIDVRGSTGVDPDVRRRRWLSVNRRPAVRTAEQRRCGCQAFPL